MDQQDDHIYIAQIRAGDIQAYRFLVAKYKDMAYTLALSILKDKMEAEDAAQESFIKAYQKLHTFRRDSKFSTWLYTIAYRTSVYNLRHSKRTENFDAQTMETESESESQIEKLSRSEQSKQIKKAIKSLPESEGVLTTLYYLNENSIEEISEITGYSKSNIKVKLFRARKKLGKKLAPMMQ